MSSKKLSDALAKVDWQKNIAEMMADSKRSDSIAVSTLHLAVWSRQLEKADKGNPALCFIREMQSAAHNTAVLIPLGLYKPAAASLRAVIEGALYYTYFRTHVVELGTLAREKGFYIDKKEILNFHKEHTPDFVSRERKLGLISRLEITYSQLSAVIHGQIPGKWTTYTAVSDISFDVQVCNQSVSALEEVVEIVKRLFLCTVAQDFWYSFSKDAKNEILRGLPGDQKAEIGLDSA